MSSRERWTVYPLLFFALALGFKSNYRNPLEFRCQSIECQKLRVADNLSVKKINGSRYATQVAAPLRGRLIPPEEAAAEMPTTAAPPGIEAPAEREGEAPAERE